MRLGDLDHLLIKLDAELNDDARYIDIADRIRDIIDNENNPLDEDICKEFLNKRNMAVIPGETLIELQLACGTHRSQGKWGKWVISEIRCPNCLEYFQPDCYSTEELNKCPNCGAKMEVKNSDEL